MAIFTDLDQVTSNKHCVFESSNLKSTIVGNIYDGICTEDVDNGQALILGDYTGEGLQERTVAIAKDITKPVVIAGTVPLIKDAMTTEQGEPYNFYNKAGKTIRCYEVVKDDIFGISKEFVTGDTQKLKIGAFVKLNANGQYEISETDPSATNAFVGKIHSIAAGTFYDLVRILVVQNKEIA